VFQFVFEFTADELGGVGLLVALGGVNVEFELIGFGVLVGCGLVVANLALQGLDFCDGALHRNLE
jgi:hypothetical protein